jgi:hypothetical protein
MSSRSQRHAPRHLAGTPRAEWVAPAAELDPADDVDLLEVTPVARVQRSRLAFAVSVTLAALPLLVLDNMPATAGTDQQPVEVQAAAAPDESSSSLETTSTTEAPTTTTTEAPTTTVAPSTTAAEATTTTEEEEAPAVQALAAPAPTEAPAPPPTAPPTTAAPAPPPPSVGDPSDPATWDRLAQCESHGRWDLNTGNGYYGGLQFSLGSWQGVGGTGYPHQASRAEQIKRGQILQARYGWGQWPHCSAELGYR